jgi:hypothetical protein
LTPEEIRNHPDAKVDENDIPVTGARGSAARVWSVCLDVCARGDDSTWVDGTVQQALEVTRDGFRTSALHDFTLGAGVSHAVDDWSFVTSGGPALVDSQGRRLLLTEGGSLPVTSVAGPLVYAPQGVAWVDLEARQLHALESDAGVWDWSGAADTWFWGNVYLVDDAGRVTQQGLTWRDPDGTFGVRMLPIEVTGYSTQMLPDGTPGTMAAVDPGPPALLHVSTDYGATWQVRTIPPDQASPGGPVDYSALPDDWESWPTPSQ